MTEPTTSADAKPAPRVRERKKKTFSDAPPPTAAAVVPLTPAQLQPQENNMGVGMGAGVTAPQSVANSAVYNGMMPGMVPSMTPGMMPIGPMGTIMPIAPPGSMSGMVAPGMQPVVNQQALAQAQAQAHAQAAAQAAQLAQSSVNTVLSSQQLLALEKARNFARTQLAAALGGGPKVAPVVDAEKLKQQQEEAARQRALGIMSRIYVGSINFDIDEPQIEAEFKVFGPIKSVSMSRDVSTGKHKGFCFVEYDTPEAATLALEQMNGASMGDRFLKVGRPNNAPQAVQQMEDLQKLALEHPRLYVAAVHEELSVEDIQSVFEAFGTVKECRLGFDLGKSHHKGYGYIEYEDIAVRDAAVAAMNLFDLGGQLLRVCAAVTPPMPNLLGTAHGLKEMSATDNETALRLKAAVARVENKHLGGASTDTPEVTPSTNTVTPSRPDSTTIPVSTTTAIPTSTTSAPAPDDGSLAAAIEAKANKMAAEADVEQTSNKRKAVDDEENIQITGTSQRFMLMQKLARKSDNRVVLLKNMYPPDEDVNDPELEEEIREECSNYGTVEKVVFYKDTFSGPEPEIKVFVQFRQTEETVAAIASLNGRWFDGKQIVAETYDGELFAANDFTG
ncbi:hypothetical protein SARC_01759 [Sphaeroforma arctica JP610]|uniref:RRM domain-containing protein n=1 Tax=Sphaeroforma arctica JP610 TaxID=667725 RepID=A0A0L0GAU6_9EUKA|nr:hypothetical protein SARC_01759 [Sphaeroforma arctica JP610]KNC86100.1 hypothetical protein SARC_01759 [Sphaeroforma arctica JP610]|eukprot:XP_014160002.1 hypothetical protein SARC_01759 [Sphaeroforma arctica JP610]